MMQPSEIERLIKEGIPGAEVLVQDLTGTLDHFQAIVVSEKFEGLNMVAQHQLVYKALQEQMKEAIHALSLKTFTPSEWEKNKPGGQQPQGIS